MDKTPRSTDAKLPVTAELGDEGGSYGDATNQAETFKGATGNPVVDPKRVGPIARDADASEPDRSPEDEIKHATEPPAARKP
ncbi:MAG: hypothetical protein ACRD1U_09990 [Vicinamibacterales bacterium]